ncbi:4032_t:CDS:10 [Acaulospora colombiana]|uniref:4032_t:CDS:1 n=1 Tax=Acaulospora colombiana TaxID=27376 RepID=A0ACA9JXN1_9GLOM|nr:4032_t:CDS:10 [Acaulospora colombiana]
MKTSVLEIDSTIPEFPVDSTDPEVTFVFSDGDSSDEKSLDSKESDENFRPTHHNLLTPQLRRSASDSSFSSYASSPDALGSNDTVKNLTEENSLALGESGVLAHNWYGKSGGSIHADGRWFKDEQGRVCLMRGVNLCGNSKLPTKPDGSSHLFEGFFDHRNVSFIGRPFALEEVHEHFARLRTWGLTFVRLLVTWEALEHSGPGIYDEEYIDYLINVIEEMPRYGIKCFIDPHQDCVRGKNFIIMHQLIFNHRNDSSNRLCKLFKETGAAYVHNTNHQPGDSLPMVWPTNYTKLASSTMFTLFWGGKSDLTIKNLNILKSPGYIGLSDFHRYDAGTTLVFGDSPSALQSFALGDGIAQEVEVWTKSWPFPTRKSSTRIMNKDGASTWINGECIWRKHGLWEVDSKTGKPKVLKPDYFIRHPKTGEKLDFYKDFYLPFVKRYSEGIQSVKSDYLVFVEPIPNEGAQHIVSATYFGISGAKKNYFGQVQNIVRKGLKNAGNKPCVIGECGIPMDINDKKAFETGDYKHHINFLDAVLGAMEGNLVNFTLWNYNPTNDNIHGDHWYGEDFSIFSPPPTKTVVSELPSVTAIPADVYPSSQLKSQVQKGLTIETFIAKEQMYLDSMEGPDAEVYAECTTTSPTSPFNLNPWEFDQESFYDPSHNTGGRVLDAVLRPYASKFPGIPQTMTFNLKTKEFNFKFVNFPHDDDNLSKSVAPEAEIFIPTYHYKKLALDIRVSDGDWRYVRNGQTLYWRVKDWSTEGLVHSLRIRVIDGTNSKSMATSGSVELSHNVSKKLEIDSDEFKVYNARVILVLVVTLLLASKERNARDFDDLEADTGNITNLQKSTSFTTKTGKQHFIILVHIIQATIIGDERDAIFEPNVIDFVKQLVEKSLEYIPEIYKSLCHSYNGEPSKIQLISDLYDEFVSSSTQPKAEVVCQDALKKMLLEKYDAAKIDEVAKSSGEVLETVFPLIQSAYWRQVIYELSEKYPESYFLSLLIQRIADKGHFREIKYLKTSATYIEVYSKVLLDQFDTLIQMDEAGVQKHLPDLIRTVSLHPHSYLFVQTLIKRLSQEPNGYPLRKLSKELEKGVNKLGSDLIPNLRSLIAAPPNFISSSILYIPPTPGDVVAEMANGEIDSSKVDTTFETLKKLAVTLSKKGATGSEFNSIVPDLLVYIDTPIASMATIFWIKYLLRETSFYEKHFKANEVPIPHWILEEIAYRHPYQRGHVFNAYKADLESSHKLTPEVMTTLKKQLLDRMIFMISTGFVMQVLMYIEKNINKLDEKLVLKMTSPPYSSEFYSAMLRLIEPINIVLEAGLETRPLIQKFLFDCPILDEKRARDAVERLNDIFS